MKLHSLKPKQGSIKSKKRIGRGQGSGRGGTSTRGHKGAKSRSGYKTKLGFEGGQMPLQRRVPKFGFKNPNQQVYTVLNLSNLQKLSEKNPSSVFDESFLRSLRILRKNNKLKILSDGELNLALEVSAHAFSKKAKEKIEKVGGKVTVIE